MSSSQFRSVCRLNCGIERVDDENVNVSRQELMNLWNCLGNKFFTALTQLIWFAFSALTLLVGRQEGHPACKKTEWWGAGVVVCLERGADLHMAQLWPLPLTVSCFSKIQTGFTFLVPAHPGSPGKRAVKRVCVCVTQLIWKTLNRVVGRFTGMQLKLPCFSIKCQRSASLFVSAHLKSQCWRELVVADAV